MNKFGIQSKQGSVYDWLLPSHTQKKTKLSQFKISAKSARIEQDGSKQMR